MDAGWQRNPLVGGYPSATVAFVMMVAALFASVLVLEDQVQTLCEQQRDQWVAQHDAIVAVQDRDPPYDKYAPYELEAVDRLVTALEKSIGDKPDC